MAVRVKICGITNAKDAELAAEAGADALGFVFVPGSPRCIDPDIARGIIKELPPLITPVGVFADHPVGSTPEPRIHAVGPCGIHTAS